MPLEPYDIALRAGLSHNQAVAVEQEIRRRGLSGGAARSLALEMFPEVARGIEEARTSPFRGDPRFDFTSGGTGEGANRTPGRPASPLPDQGGQTVTSNPIARANELVSLFRNGDISARDFELALDNLFPEDRDLVNSFLREAGFDVTLPDQPVAPGAPPPPTAQPVAPPPLPTTQPPEPTPGPDPNLIGPEAEGGTAGATLQDLFGPQQELFTNFQNFVNERLGRGGGIGRSFARSQFSPLLDRFFIDLVRNPGNTPMEFPAFLEQGGFGRGSFGPGQAFSALQDLGSALGSGGANLPGRSQAALAQLFPAIAEDTSRARLDTLNRQNQLVQSLLGRGIGAGLRGGFQALADRQFQDFLASRNPATDDFNFLNSLSSNPFFRDFR